jgi:cytochrome P450
MTTLRVTTVSTRQVAIGVEPTDEGAFTMTLTDTAPSSDIDLYSDEAVHDPYDLHARLRRLGPVVWMTQLNAYVVTRDEPARDVLTDPATFSSAAGVTMNEAANAMTAGSMMITTDPPLHQDLRRVFQKPLRRGALQKISEDIASEADELILDLVARETFDAAVDLAPHLPLSIVSHLIGVPEQGREKLLIWANAFLNFATVDNERSRAAAPLAGEMVEWAGAHIRSGLVSEDGWAQQLFDAGDRGDLPEGWAGRLVLDYMIPSLDTTINATSSLIVHLGRNPDQWALLKEQPALIPRAVGEAIRLETPIQMFSRTTTRQTRLGDVLIPPGARVGVLLGSANRDDERWERADEFDITRPDATDHLGFGIGEHLCVGQGLAQLEMQSLLKSMIDHVDVIEVVDAHPQSVQGIRGFSSVPTRFA